MGERNYWKQEIETQKTVDTDKLLDELNVHLKEVERIKGELVNSLIDKSDSENKEEQRINIPITGMAFENPLNKKLKEEEEKILELKSKIAQQNQ